MSLAFSEQDFIDIVSSDEVDLFYDGTQDGLEFSYSAADTLVKKYEENKAKTEVIKLVGSFCSMYMIDKSREPFGPMWVVNGKRTFLPEDLDTDTAQLLYNNLQKIQNLAVKTRIADSLWVAKKLGKDNIEAAKVAVAGYYTLIDNALDKGHLHTAHDYISRVYRLSLSMQNTEERKDLWSKFPEYAEKKYDKSNDSNSFYWHNLLDKTSELSGLDTNVLQKLYDKTDSIIKALTEGQASPNFIWVRKFYGIIIRLAKALNIDATAVNNLRINKIQTFETEANQAKINMQKSHLLKEAIAEYRKLPGQQQKVSELTQIIAELSVDLPFQTISQSADITDIVNSVKQNITGKEFKDALFTFVILFNSLFKDSIDKKKCKELTENLNKNSMLYNLFSQVHFSSDGRVVNTASTDEERLEESMIQHATMSNNLSITAIIHGLHVLNDEHRYQLDDITRLVEGSPVVPQNNTLIISKGIYSFLMGDMMEASHFLVLQFEECLRHLLYGKAQTTRIPSENQEIEHKNTDLEYLLGECEKLTIFDENITWFFKTYLISNTKNIRNDIAHGMISDKGYYNHDICVICYGIIWFILFHKIDEHYKNMKA